MPEAAGLRSTELRGKDRAMGPRQSIGWCLAWAFTGVLLACGSAPPPDLQSSNVPPVDPDSPQSVLAHLTVPEGEEARKRWMADAVVRARQHLLAFASEHGWQEMAAIRTFDHVEMVTDGAALWQRILSIYDMPDDTPYPGAKLPVAGLEGRVLLAVTPSQYAVDYPTQAERPDAYSRLLAHELAHRMHVEILLGDEEAMGPRWFYEGFAVIAAGQGFDEGLAYASADEALAGIEASGPDSYRRYAAAVRYFAARTPLPELVRQAGAPGFEDWLRQQDAG